MTGRDAALDLRLRKGWNESGVEGALAEDRPEMVRQAKGVGEGFVHDAGAQHRRQHDVADEAGDPRDEGPAADAENLLQHFGPSPGSPEEARCGGLDGREGLVMRRLAPAAAIRQRFLVW